MPTNYCGSIIHYIETRLGAFDCRGRKSGRNDYQQQVDNDCPNAWCFTMQSSMGVFLHGRWNQRGFLRATATRKWEWLYRRTIVIFWRNVGARGEAMRVLSNRHNRSRNGVVSSREIENSSLKAFKLARDMAKKKSRDNARSRPFYYHPSAEATALSGDSLAASLLHENRTKIYA